MYPDSEDHNIKMYAGLVGSNYLNKNIRLGL